MTIHDSAYTLKHKSKASKIYKKEVKTQLGRSIKAFNSNGGEYEAIDDFYKQSRIKHIYTMPYTSQQNGIAKRRN